MSYKLANKQALELGHLAGAGGEAQIFSVKDNPRQVAKIYHKPNVTRTAKLRAMLASPPSAGLDSPNHVSIAWPQDLVYDLTNHCVGFLMPSINTTTNLELSKLYHPLDRRDNAPGFNWKYLIHTARNLAGVLNVLHSRGYVVGDLNESNLLVGKTALVTLVDCDSMQVQAGSGSTARIFRCQVGKPEYTPPELQGSNFNEVLRTPAHDNFGLAVLVFLLLMEGVHPFQVRWSGEGDPPSIAEAIAQGFCPYLPESTVKPPLFALPFNILPPNLQKLFWHCFGEGQQDLNLRPSAAAWFEALREAEQELAVCNLNSQHLYSRHLESCPWCVRVRRGFTDSFPPATQIFNLLREAQIPRAMRSQPNVVRSNPISTSTRSVNAMPVTSRKASRSFFTRIRWRYFFSFSYIIIFVSTLLMHIVTNLDGNNSNINPVFSPDQRTSIAKTSAVLFATPDLTDSLSNYFATAYPKVFGTYPAYPTFDKGLLTPPTAFSSSFVTPAPKPTLALPTATPQPVVSPTIALIKTLTGHSGPVNLVAFSSDGKLLASGSADSTVKIWDVATGQLITTLSGYGGKITGLAFNPKNNNLFSVSAYGPVKVYDVAKQQQLTSIANSIRYSNTLAFSPDGNTLVTADAYDLVVYNLDSATGQYSSSYTTPLYPRKSSRPLNSQTALAINQDGTMLAVETQNHSITLQDTQSPKILDTLQLPPSGLDPKYYNGTITSLAFSPTSPSLISAIDTGSFVSWNLTTGRQIGIMDNIPSSINAVKFSPINSFFVTAYSDGKVFFYNAWTGDSLKGLPTQPSSIQSLAFSPDGTLLAIAGEDKSIKLWSVHS
jgi:WD40 repeat protein